MIVFKDRYVLVVVVLSILKRLWETVMEERLYYVEYNIDIKEFYCGSWRTPWRNRKKRIH